MVKLLQTENFFDEKDAENLYHVTRSLKFVDSEYGQEVPNFNYVLPDLDPIFSQLLGADVEVDEENSGVFRRPKTSIHFESFSGPNDWIFVVALEPTTFNLYYHVPTGARSALEEYQLNYRNFLQWNYYTNVLLERNNGLIFKPWLFHSLQDGLIQVYRIREKQKNG